MEGIAKLGFWLQLKAAVRFQAEGYTGISRIEIGRPTPRLVRRRLMVPIDLSEMLSDGTDAMHRTKHATTNRKGGPNRFRKGTAMQGKR
jgi:hypothetical protein